MIVVDVETTGTDPQRHALVSIGAVAVMLPEGVFNKGFYLDCRIDDTTEVTKEALAINGFSEADIRNPKKASLEEITRKFIEWTGDIEDITLAGQNVSFDVAFLIEACKRTGIAWPFGNRSLDTHTMTYAHQFRCGLAIPSQHRHSGINSDRVFDYVGLPHEPKPHHAYTGAKMFAEVIVRLLCGRNLFPDWQSYPVPEYLQQESSKHPCHKDATQEF